MLKYMMVLAGTLVVFAAADEAQARFPRRARNSCPNGQCYASTPTTTKAVATTSEADATVTEAPALGVASNIAPATYVARTIYRPFRGTRFFRRR